MITAGTYGAPNWVDLSTHEVTGALAFYGRLFDWTIEKSHTPMGDYFIGHVDGNQVAGMMQAAPEMGDMAMWTTFIYVEDVDATTKRVADAGGVVLEKPFDIPGGRVGVVADPTAAMFGVISGEHIEGTWFSRDPGRVSWVETLTRDPARSEGFYTAVFDWKAETRDMGEVMYTTFSLDDEPVAGMMTMPDAVPREAPAHWAVYFTVGNCEATIELATDLGGLALGPAMETDLGSFAVLQDPQGAVFQIMDYNE